jgi:hypothetical protein
MKMEGLYCAAQRISGWLLLRNLFQLSKFYPPATYARRYPGEEVL